jgi:multidrug transporter EmrE-like cation transporter
MIKYIGSIIVLLVVASVYIFMMKKEDRLKHRYVIFSSTGFALTALPSWFIKNEMILTVLSIVSIILVVFGMFLYMKMRKLEKKKRR